MTVIYYIILPRTEYSFFIGRERSRADHVLSHIRSVDSNIQSVTKFINDSADETLFFYLFSVLGKINSLHSQLLTGYGVIPGQ